MNKCSDELWTIAVALDCHQDGEPKKVLDRVLQRICDYQACRRLIVAADDASSWSGFDSVQCREAFSVAAKFARHIHADQSKGTKIVQPTLILDNRL